VKYTFVITQDPKLLDQYYRLRESSFRKELGIPDFDGGEEAYDREGTVLLGVGPKGRVLAGARINGCSPSQDLILPIETPAFRLRESFSDLALAQRPYCTWGRTVIAPEVRCDHFAQVFADRLLECSLAMGYEVAFMVTDRRRSRYYRRVYRSLGYDFEISGVEVPSCGAAFQGLEHLVSYAMLPSGDSAVAKEKRGLQLRTRLRNASQIHSDAPLRLLEGGLSA
jgi:hypothetical protein